MADLAPCPRCGDTRAAADLVRRGDERVWVVLCPACGTHLPGEPDARGYAVATANRFVEGDADFNSVDNLAFQPGSGIMVVIEDHENGDIFACLPDGEDRDVKTDGCVKILSVRDSSAEPTGFMFSADGLTAYVSIQHSNDGNMSKVDDYATDDVLKITGFKPVKKGKAPK